MMHVVYDNAVAIHTQGMKDIFEAGVARRRLLQNSLHFLAFQHDVHKRHHAVAVSSAPPGRCLAWGRHVVRCCLALLCWEDLSPGAQRGTPH